MDKTFKRFTSGLCLCLLLLFAPAPTASAHILKTNNGTVAVLHVPPDDKPMAGAPTKLELLLYKNTGEFELSKYTINLQVVEHGKRIQQVSVGPEFVGNPSTGITTVIFPKIDVYEIVVIGTAKSSADKSFTTNYELRVATAVKRSNADTELLLVGMTLAIIVVMVGIRVFVDRKSLAGIKRKSGKTRS
jgi:hypothetical protein